MVEIKAFNRWSTSDIQVSDPGLKEYITLEPKIVPKTGAKYAKTKFHKSNTFIIERLINRLMVSGHKGKKHFRSSGHNTGKANQAYKIVLEALQIIEQKTKKNPIEQVVLAIENGAPRDETVTIEYGGARYPKPVECSPQRRVDLALKHIAQGTYSRCFDKKKSAANALAEEILATVNLSSDSNAVSKKKNIERQADSSR
ncbi:MAG: 30S ribosomal protein S7 [Candidatus Woesearchaeota archaeon]|nr:30S ribosomal protein S7 [Candidatus Woesearchaeota archaeon]